MVTAPGFPLQWMTDNSHHTTMTRKQRVLQRTMQKQDWDLHLQGAPHILHPRNRDVRVSRCKPYTCRILWSVLKHYKLKATYSLSDAVSTPCRGMSSQGRGMPRSTGSDGQQGNTVNNRPPLYADSSSAPGAPRPVPPQGNTGLVRSCICNVCPSLELL